MTSRPPWFLTRSPLVTLPATSPECETLGLRAACRISPTPHVTNVCVCACESVARCVANRSCLGALRCARARPPPSAPPPRSYINACVCGRVSEGRARRCGRPLLVTEPSRCDCPGPVVLTSLPFGAPPAAPECGTLGLARRSFRSPPPPVLGCVTLGLVLLRFLDAPLPRLF